MLLAIGFAGFEAPLKFLLEPGLRFLLFLDCLSFAFEPDFLNGVSTSLDDVEAVDYNGGVREHSLDCGGHAVGEVHRYLPRRQGVELGESGAVSL